MAVQPSLYFIVMPSRIQNFVKDYLSFSARERNGLVVLFVAGGGFYLFTHQYKPQKPQTSNQAFQQQLATLKISIDSSQRASRYVRTDNFHDYYQPRNTTGNLTANSVLFAFDPNTLDAAGWKKLGVRDKTISIIQNFVARGYLFRQADDLRKIYGLRKEDADRLIPYVRIATSAAAPAKAGDPKPAYVKYAPAEDRRNTVIDINTADICSSYCIAGYR